MAGRGRGRGWGNKDFSNPGESDTKPIATEQSNKVSPTDAGWTSELEELVTESNNGIRKFGRGRGEILTAMEDRVLPPVKQEEINEPSSSCRSHVSKVSLPPTRNSTSPSPATPAVPSGSPKKTKKWTTNNLFRRPLKASESVKSLEVKLKKMVEPGCFLVASPDKKILDRFERLNKNMKEYYTIDKLGTRHRIQDNSLKVGEIVAAKVITRPSADPDIEKSKFCRLKITRIAHQIKIFRNQKEKVIIAHGVDIDDVSHWTVWVAFKLHEYFYCYKPSQACPMKILNYHDLHPKGIFEIFFNDEEKFSEVMRTLTDRVFGSIIGRNIMLENISSEDEMQTSWTAGINLDINFRLTPLYIEEFCNYFTPTVPEDNVWYEGIITGVHQYGTVCICKTDSLYSAINRLLNTDDLHRFAQTVSAEDRIQILRTYRKYLCRRGIAYNCEKSRLLRVLIEGWTEGVDQVRIKLIDIGTDFTFVKTEQLVFGMTTNIPNIFPSLLALIPPQAQSFKLAGISSLNKEQCDDILRLCEKGVKFKVFQGKLREMELLNPIESSTEALNVILKEAGPDRYSRDKRVVFV